MRTTGEESGVPVNIPLPEKLDLAVEISLSSGNDSVERGQIMTSQLSSRTWKIRIGTRNEGRLPYLLASDRMR